MWESEDLIHWGSERCCPVGVPGAGCVWTPEAVSDREKEAFLVFFASKTKREGQTQGKQRIYAAWTADFRSFSETFLYMERENHVIDITILESGGWYYRISRDETEKKLLLERARGLTGDCERIPSQVLDELKGVEGPGYLPMVTEDLSGGEFRILEPEEYHMGMKKKRHGGVLAITDEEYGRLEKQFL